jgi:hypothetical protein
MNKRKVKEADVELTFTRVRKESKHVKALYLLLQEREHGISHKTMPTFREHREFVMNHPYRAWYLVSMGKMIVGTIYLLKDNSIGVNLPGNSPEMVSAAVNWIRARFQPLRGRKSVRSHYFHVNASTGNEDLQSALRKMGATPIQVTFAFLTGFPKRKG